MSQIPEFSLRADEEFIELFKLLKVEGLCADGAEAKHVIAEGMVTVNGEVETRKRKKLLAGDLVSYKGKQVQVVAAA
ncbi:RNA-binding S4 domain-containing protein [Shewanella yunxiaonensis]|uniref:RNA-binding S4 domain-containing protein n=1 Tax=Shewanella yunxiaonensis TaxID=2829809 RepID=A0ABX7YPI4_9GAMM|nr:RNA-binding S4 domain-containing protein [Shewanella yunxiaonensis]QUN04665.1 RNA-binding S4 domain-containing protein [Shewanella yunxiaonensis]